MSVTNGNQTKTVRYFFRDLSISNFKKKPGAKEGKDLSL